MISLRLYLIACAYLAAVLGSHAQTIGLLDANTNTTQSYYEFETGDWEFNSFYSLEQDIPEQRAALRTLYDATGGPHWSSVYNDSAALQDYLSYAAGLPATGIRLITRRLLFLYKP